MAAPTPAAQFTGSQQVGCFSALPFSKPQSSMEQWLRMLTWSRYQLPVSWLVQCRNQELNPRPPVTPGAAQGSACGCWSHPPLLTEMLQLLLLALTYTNLCYALTKIISFLKHKNFSAKIAAFIPKAGCPDTRLSQVGTIPVQRVGEADSLQKRKWFSKMKQSQCHKCNQDFPVNYLTVN